MMIELDSLSDAELIRLYESVHPKDILFKALQGEGDYMRARFSNLPAGPQFIPPRIEDLEQRYEDDTENRACKQQVLDKATELFMKV
tara:strand:- start:155 stop:415 length:261 start_codon:yes stop_codon:yes gene_type:complete